MAVDFAQCRLLFKNFKQLALRSKHDVEAPEKLALWIGSFRPTQILHCDSGTQIKDSVFFIFKKV